MKRMIFTIGSGYSAPKISFVDPANERLFLDLVGEAVLVDSTYAMGLRHYDTEELLDVAIHYRNIETPEDLADFKAAEREKERIAAEEKKTDDLPI